MKRGVVVAIAAGAAAVVIGAGVAWFALTRPAGPDAAARDYLAALAAGDGERALSLVAGDPGGSAAEALAGAIARIEDPVVTRVGGAAGTTRADVTFTLDGAEHSASFGLVEVEGDWRVDADGLGALTATTTIGDAVDIGGVLVDTGADAALLPALYDVTAAPTGLVAGSTTATVLPGSTETVAVEASLSPDATAAVQEQLDAYAAACTAPASAVPPNCGIRVPWAADLGALAGIAFCIDTAPAVTIAPDARTFAATGGVLVATATGTTRDGAAASFTYRADDWALRGSISFTGDEMVLSVD